MITRPLFKDGNKDMACKSGNGYDGKLLSSAKTVTQLARLISTAYILFAGMSIISKHIIMNCISSNPSGTTVVSNQKQLPHRDARLPGLLHGPPL